MIRKIFLNIRCKQGVAIPVEFTLYDEDEENRKNIRIDFDWPGLSYKISKDNFWEALTEVRQFFERRECLLICNGTSIDSAMSGMSLEMSGGEMAYKVRWGQPAKTTDLVRIFEIDEPVRPSTIMEQQDYIAKWRASIRAR